MNDIEIRALYRDLMEPATDLEAANKQRKLAAEAISSLFQKVESLREENRRIAGEVVKIKRMDGVREEVYERFRITGSITVDRLRELVEADKVGRCVVLPCKYGERVYCVYHKREEHFGCAHCLAGYGMGVVCDYYNAETDTCSNSPEKYKNYEIISKHFEAGMIPNFGKTVFKSSKDAESACKRLEKEMVRQNEI